MMHRLVVAAAAVLVMTGCSKPVPEGTMIFSPEGVSGDVNYPLDAFEVFELNAADFTDTFELRGENACICGKLWPQTNFGETGWQRLVGANIVLESHGGNPLGRRASSVVLEPWGGNTLSTGIMVIERVEQAGERVVVSGRIKYTFETNKGERRGSAAFKVQAQATRVER